MWAFFRLWAAIKAGLLFVLFVVIVPLWALFAFPSFWLGVLGTALFLTVIPSYLWGATRQLTGTLRPLSRLGVIVTSLGGAYLSMWLGLRPYLIPL